jgi:hypothetical protein
LASSQKMEGILKGIPSSQPTASSLPKLIGPDDEVIEIPMSVFRTLRLIVGYLMLGKAFSVIPYDQLLTTQEAADFQNKIYYFLSPHPKRMQGGIVSSGNCKASIGYYR